MAYSRWGDFRERLIDEVKARRVLWDPDQNDHKNYVVTSEAWKEIGESIGIPAESAKMCFKNLRDAYRKKRKEVLMKKLNREEVPCIRWRLYPHMTFLDPYMTVDISASATDFLVDQDETDDESEETTVYRARSPPVVSSTRALRKRSRNTAKFSDQQSETAANDRMSRDAYAGTSSSDSGQRYSNETSTSIASGPTDGIMSHLEDFSDRFKGAMDTEGLFGLYIAESLRKFPQEKRSKAKYLIQKALYEVDCKLDGQLCAVDGDNV